jgi:MerC mercury resistance protein
MLQRATYFVKGMKHHRISKRRDSRTVSAQRFFWGQIDRWAIGLSGLCLAHCIASALFFAVLASAGGYLLHPAIHEIGLSIAMVFGAIALGRGVMTHGYVMPVWVGSLGLGVMAGALTMPHDGSETVYTILGVLIVALGHDLNRRAIV